MSARLSIAEVQNAIEQVAAAAAHLDRLAHDALKPSPAPAPRSAIRTAVIETGLALTYVARVLRDLDDRTREPAR